jgi:hypothetical protein
MRPSRISRLPTCWLVLAGWQSIIAYIPRIRLEPVANQQLDLLVANQQVHLSYCRGEYPAIYRCLRK